MLGFSSPVIRPHISSDMNSRPSDDDSVGKTAVLALSSGLELDWILTSAPVTTLSLSASPLLRQILGQRLKVLPCFRSSRTLSQLTSLISAVPLKMDDPKWQEWIYSQHLEYCIIGARAGEGVGCVCVSLV